ncbi:MAG: MarR family transcriptional regulator [Burkholderiales bacterium]|nr:MarR family transcriptional regulator [Burkholderiales bacterium]MDE2275194.1 MarR family transcriptional regulator [Burkholderiales bacterium]
MIVRVRARPDAAALSLGPLARVVGFHLARASALTAVLYERHVGAPLNLRKAEFSVLMLLLANRAVPPKQLAQALAVTAPALTLLLDRLQQRGLLRREPNPRDGRSQHVVLTEAGQRLAADAAAAAAPMEAGLRERLSPAEQAMLIELLEKLGG